MDSLNIDLVIHGETDVAPETDGSDPYKVDIFYYEIVKSK